MKMTKEEQALHAIKLLNLKDSILMSSFQTTSVVLLNLFHELEIKGALTQAKIDVGFIDTGHHFKETLGYRDVLVKKFGFKLIIVDSGLHEDIWKTNKDACCSINKLQPFNYHLMKDYRTYISGAYGRDVQFCDLKFDKIKFCPLYDWAYSDFMEYIDRKKLPKHPLHKKGYLSIGCWPCTVVADRDERSGRWPGSNKNRCGL